MKRTSKAKATRPAEPAKTNGRHPDLAILRDVVPLLAALAVVDTRSEARAEGQTVANIWQDLAEDLGGYLTRTEQKDALARAELIVGLLWGMGR